MKAFNQSSKLIYSFSKMRNQLFFDSNSCFGESILKIMAENVSIINVIFIAKAV